MSIGANPFMYDEDNDVLSDGVEVEISMYLWHSTNINSPDTDNDGIGDKAEWEAYWWAYKSNYGDGNKSLRVNPIYDDTYNDSDGDGLTNIEEWQQSGYTMDYDNDGIPNFYDTDDDKDGLPTSVELSADLTPFNIADAHGDKDSDGLDNLWEYENGTMIMDADTDHDGINDGAEFKYWQNYLHDEWETWENVNETAVEYLKNPDVDRDNVTDGKEINGWKVKVITGYDENNNPISKEVTLYGDPLKPYMDKNGAYIDADEDNIPDIVESLLSNNSTFAKFAEWALNNDIELWRAYNWTIVYLYSIRNHISFADNEELLNDSLHGKDEIKAQIGEWEDASPHNKSCAENATQWLRDEFNPLITESMPPVITQFAAVSDVGFFYAYTKVSVELRDPSGIGTIRLISKPEKNSADIYDIRIFDAGGNTTWSIENLKLNITATSSTWHYYVVCNATDTLGNTAQWSKEIKGVLKVIVDTVANALSALWGFLCEVGKKIAEAVNFIVEWFKSLAKAILDKVVGPITNTLSEWVEEIKNAFIKALQMMGASTTRGDGEASDVKAILNILINVLFGWNFALLIGLGTAMITIDSIAKVFPPAYAILAGIMIGVVASILIIVGKVFTEKPPELPPNAPSNDPYKLDDYLRSEIPPEKWWATNAPLAFGSVISMFVTRYMAKMEFIPSKTPFGFALSMLAYILYGISPMVLILPLPYKEFISLGTDVFGFVISCISLMYLPADLFQYLYKATWTFTMLISTTAVAVGGMAIIYDVALIMGR